MSNLIIAKQISGGTNSQVLTTVGGVAVWSNGSDIYTTGTTVVGNTAYFDTNDALSAYTLDLSTIDTDIYTTGSTLVDTTLYFDTNDTISAYTADLSSISLWSAGTNTNSIFQKGSNSLSSGRRSVAIGEETSATTTNSFAQGYRTKASGLHSHAEGNSTIASGSYGHAEGWSTVASGQNGSHAEGRATTASGDTSHAEGLLTIASGNVSHAEGSSTLASGSNSHAEGSGTIASGINSHAEGNSTIASGQASHAEGTSTEANAFYSHAEGVNTKAIGLASHVGGFGFGVGNKITAAGHSSFAHFYMNSTFGEIGALADYSVVLGGVSNNVDTGSTSSVILGGGNNEINGATNSVVLGGNSIIGTANDTVYVPNLNINSSLANDDALTQILVRATDGTVKYRDASSLVGSGGTDTNTFVTGGTYDNGTGIATFTNNSGGTFTVTGFSTGGAGTDIYTTGTTVVGNTAYFDTNDALSAYTLDLSTIDGTSYWSATTGNALILNNTIGNTNTGLDSIVLGTNNTNSGVGTITFGDGNTNNAYSIVGGTNNTVIGTRAAVFGANSQATSYGFSGGRYSEAGPYSFAWGFTSKATGSYAHAQGYYVNADGNSSHAQNSQVRALGISSHAGGSGFNPSTSRIVALGDVSFVHFRQTSASGYIGANSNFSAILGGTDHNIDASSESSSILGGDSNRIVGATGTTVLGGQAITGITDNTVYVPNLNIDSSLANDDALTQILVRATDGTVKYRDVSSIGGSGGTSGSDTFITGFTYNNANEFTLTNNSGDTLSVVANTMTGLTVSGILSAVTLSATSLFVTNEDWVIELVDEQTVDFWAPYNMIINEVETVASATTIELFDDDVSYTTGTTITSGSKITVSALTQTVINLKTIR